LTATFTNFSSMEIVLSAAIALLAQLGGFVLLKSGGGTVLHADISDERARPISVAITPIVDDAPLLKLGSKRQPGKLPDRWTAPRPVARSVAQAFPSPHAPATPAAIPTLSVADAGQKPPPPEADLAKQVDVPVETAEQKPAPVSTVEGAADGVKEGTETDPLKAHIISEYKAKLDQFFSSRFKMRGKLPFDVLKTLRAVAVVNISPDRTVTGFTITRPSGNATFDDELRSTLSSIVANGTELPPPPSPDMLSSSQTFAFQCKNRSACE
jgi:hypothetical protein